MSCVRRVCPRTASGRVEGLLGWCERKWKNTAVPFGVIHGSVAQMGTSMVMGATGPGPVYMDNASLTVCRTTKGRGLLTRETGVNGVTENSVTIANTCGLGTGCVVRAMNPM